MVSKKTKRQNARAARQISMKWKVARTMGAFAGAFTLGFTLAKAIC